MTRSSVSSPTGQGSRAATFLPAQTLLGFVIAFVAVLFITFFSVNSLKTREVAAGHVTHALDSMDRLQSVLSLLKDAETGQRGFLLTGTESYLDPYVKAKAALPGEIRRLQTLMAGNAAQQPRLELLGQFATAKLEELANAIALRRAGDAAGALAVVNTGRGKSTMEDIRAVAAQMQGEEQLSLSTYQAEWQDAVRYSSFITLGGCALLLFLIAVAAGMSSRDYRARETETWLRAGQALLGLRIQGEQRIDVLGTTVLEFLASHLNAQVGAIYVAESDGSFRRVAGHALAPGADNAEVRAGDGLLGQAAKEDRPLHITDVPEGYLPVVSGLGRSAPRQLLIAPASVDGMVHAIIELGFLHSVLPADRELLARVSESLGIAVRSSRDRTRLEELLGETQRQSEELQAQQEELRVNNEELEEQGRVLKQSQAQLEGQQAELEQTNSQLEEHTQLLERQKQELSDAQLVLNEKAAELERTNQYKSEFLANMSHELRTPLNSTLILAKLLADNKDGNLTAEQIRFAETISSAGNDLLVLINDILDLSKIEAGKIEVQSEIVVVADTVEAIGKSFEPIAQQKGIEFVTVPAPDTPRQIEADPQRLAQVLKNLVSNALKFTEKGQVTLRTFAASADEIAFAVSDTGIGIPSHQQGVIFDAFRQADGSTHRKYGGTGLGLSISRDLARVLGGDISVHSEERKGSTFTLTLPLVYRAQAADSSARPGSTGTTRRHDERAPAKSAASNPRALPPIAMEDDRAQLTPGSRTILVIEDDPRFAEILRDLAHEMDFQCVVTHSANDGLAAAALYHPSAILLDINLPDHSGLGVLDRLKRNPQTRHIPVHVASVADYSQEALELGAIGYALKPVKREELVTAFQRLEAKFSQGMRRILVVEDDQRQRESIRQLLESSDVQIIGVESAGEALSRLQAATFDCMVMDLSLPDLSGYELLEKMAGQDGVSFPPVIVYTGRSLTRDEEQRLRRFSKSIIIKDARSPERLLDEVTLFLHQVESKLPPEHQRMLKAARDRDSTLEGKRILVVEDDVRNIFALSSVLEPLGARVEIARNGVEAIDAIARSTAAAATAIDLVLMDIMMPEMDGLTAMREIRKRPELKKLPIIALTAKAMKDDQEKCLAAGANDYIAKPLDVEKLLSLLRVWMPK